MNHAQSWHQAVRLAHDSIYRRFFLTVTLVLMPLLTVPLTVAGFLFASSRSLWFLGILVGVVQGALLLATIAAVSAATTISLLRLPARHLPRRTLLALPGLLVALLTATFLCFPLLAYAALNPPSLWDIPVLATVWTALVWASILVAAASEIGLVPALYALRQCARREFWGVTVRGAPPVAAEALCVALAGVWGAGNPLLLWLGSLVPVFATASFAALWQSIRPGSGVHTRPRAIVLWSSARSGLQWLVNEEKL